MRPPAWPAIESRQSPPSSQRNIGDNEHLLLPPTGNSRLFLYRPVSSRILRGSNRWLSLIPLPSTPHSATTSSRKAHQLNPLPPTLTGPNRPSHRQRYHHHPSPPRLELACRLQPAARCRPISPAPTVRRASQPCTPIAPELDHPVGTPPQMPTIRGIHLPLPTDLHQAVHIQPGPQVAQLAPGQQPGGQ